MVQEKARLLAEEKGLPNFTGSNGWLEKWRKRHNIKHSSLSGESADVDPAVVEDWEKRIPSLCEGYDPSDIFNADEAGLNYRTLPTKSLVAPGDSRKGVKLMKDRLTILPACSMKGERLPLLVIGKSANPRCFKGREKATLGVIWRHNKKAWMTSSLFTDWVNSINNQMKLKGRKILLLVDNCPAHPEMTLSNVKIVFLPPNTTSKLQPCDAGIIENLKRGYRRRFLRHLLHSMDDKATARALARSVTVLDAICWVTAAWKDCKPEMIRKCWAKVGFTPESLLPEGVIETAAASSIPEIIEEEEDFSLVLEGVSMDDYVAMDREPYIQPLDSSADDAIIDQLESADPEPECPQLTLKVITEQLRAMRNYAIMKGPEFDDFLSGIMASMSSAEKLNAHGPTKKQSSIADYLQKPSRL